MKAKKSLGQNFLTNPNVIKRIIDASQIKPDDCILEIGPGKGILTREILNKGAKLIAVEKDDRLIPFLEDKFQKEIKTEQLTLVHGDILDISNEDLAIKKDYKLVANIPYYITGLLIRKFLETPRQPTRMVLLVQKEVANRIVAGDGKESVLSVSVKAYGEPHNAGLVKAGNFNPKPKVDSAILVIRHISKDFFEKNNIKEKDFFEIVKKGFSNKRKTLLNNLSGTKDKTELQKEFEKIRIEPTDRAEDIDIKKWALLTQILK